MARSEPVKLLRPSKRSMKAIRSTALPPPMDLFHLAQRRKVEYETPDQLRTTSLTRRERQTIAEITRMPRPAAADRGTPQHAVKTRYANTPELDLYGVSSGCPAAFELFASQSCTRSPPTPDGASAAPPLQMPGGGAGLTILLPRRMRRIWHQLPDPQRWDGRI